MAGVLGARPMSAVGVRGFAPVNPFLRARSRIGVYGISLLASSAYTLPVTYYTPIIFNLQYHKDISYRTYFETNTDETLIDFDTKLQYHAKSGTDADGDNDSPVEGHTSNVGWVDVGAKSQMTGIDGSINRLNVEQGALSTREYARLVLTINATGSTWTSTPNLVLEGWANTWSMDAITGRRAGKEMGSSPTWANTDIRRDLTTTRVF